MINITLETKLKAAMGVVDAARELVKQFNFVGDMQEKLLGKTIEEAEQNWDFATGGVMNFDPLLKALQSFDKSND